MISSRPSPRLLFGDGESRLLGVFGDPIAHSLSPKIHNLSLAYWDLNYRYLPFRVRPKNLEQALFGFRALGGVGFNATIPHKEALLPFMDQLSLTAKKVGAVNTVSIGPEGQFIGDNTDTYGFITVLKKQVSTVLEDKNILVLGAGGACRAVLVALLDEGCQHILLANRTRERAETLANHFSHGDPAKISTIPLDFTSLPLEEVDIIVNTTSLGLHGHDEFPLPAHRLPSHALLYDIVYSTQGTPLKRLAQKHRLTFVDGLDMLIHQAALAFKIWTGRDMPVEWVKGQLSNPGTKNE